MKKIPTIFKRDPLDMSKILDVQHPECDWVFNGEGVATRKYDGTCCLIKDGVLYRRREVKQGASVPIGFVLADSDDATKKVVGWVPVSDNDPNDKRHREAFQSHLPDGTYELIGPSVQGNPEHAREHTLFPHKDAEVLDAPRTYSELQVWLADRDIEGIVWHHPDGRMAKIKLRDFGLRRPNVSS